MQEAFARSASPLKLEWQSTDDDAVTGYALYYGPAGAAMTNRIDAGLSNAIFLTDLTAGADYAFYVVAYDSDQNESDPSNFLTYTAQAIDALRLTQSESGIVIISFNVSANASCHVEWTDTLTPPNWQFLASATGDSEGFVAIRDPDPAPSGCRFYRAAVDFPETVEDLVGDPPGADPVGDPVVEPPIEDPPTLDPPVTDPPIVDPPVVDPVGDPVVDPPVDDPPVGDPPDVDPGME